MRFLKEPLERKLSAALNARVTIDRLNVSLLGGSLEIVGVTVLAHGAADPVLTVRRVKAEIALGAMLRKEVVIKSMVIEGPAVTVVRQADGSLNLPKRERDVARSLPPATTSPPAPSSTTTTPPKNEPDDDAPSAWKLAAEKVQLLDGAVHFREGAYHVSAERIVGELLRKPDGFHLTVLAASLGRRDEPLDLGEARAHGVFRGDEIAKLAAAPVDATFDVGDIAHGAARVDGGALEGTVRVKAVLDVMRKLVPSRYLPAHRLEGDVEMFVEGSYDPQSGWRAKELTLRATEVRIRRPASDSGVSSEVVA